MNTRSFSTFSSISAYFFLSVFVSLLFVSLAHAQGVPSIQGLTLKLSDENPTPGQALTVSAESFSVDLNSASMTWTLNDGVFQKGVGITSIQVKAPEANKKLVVKITAVMPEGRVLTAQATVSSGSLDLIVESRGYTHPFFKGKLPLSYQNTYKISAIPHLYGASGEINPATLVYRWKEETSSKVFQDQSGYGKQSLVLTGDMIPRTKVITVQASSRDGTVGTQRSIIIDSGEPFVRFYKDDPLYGPLYNKSIGEGVNLGSSREISVLAVPFGFNKPASSIGNLSFSWLVNGNEQGALANNQSIILRAPSESAGSSDIELVVKNVSDILQDARLSFRAVFPKAQALEQETANANTF